MKIKIAFIASTECSCKTNNVPAVVINPDTANKPSHAGMRLWLDIKYRSFDLTQKFLADISKVVMALVKATRINEHHVHKAICRKAEAEHAGQVPNEPFRSREQP